MIYTPRELAKLQEDKPWVMAYNELQAIVDLGTQKVMYVESFGPKNGFFIEGWRALHFPLTSKLVEKSYREGGTTICVIRQGKVKLKLIPSFSPIGIEECRVKRKQVEITVAGIGGGGVSAAYSRGLAKGVSGVEVINEAGGRKLGRAKIIIPQKRLLLIGVDDTDNDTSGATYSLVHNIAEKISLKLKVNYAIHVNVQLYPFNKFKTKNCFATVVGIIFSKESEKQKILSYFKKELKENSFSSETAMASFEGFVFDKSFSDLCVESKFKQVDDPTRLIKEAKKNKVSLYEITGKRGLIGAISSLPFYDKPDFAAQLPGQDTIGFKVGT